MPTRTFKMDPAIGVVLSEQSLGKLIKEACKVWKNNTERRFNIHLEGFSFFFDGKILSLERQNELEVDDDSDPGVEHPCKRSKGVRG